MRVHVVATMTSLILYALSAFCHPMDLHYCPVMRYCVLFSPKLSLSHFQVRDTLFPTLSKASDAGEHVYR
jgi:hypothetical protein